MSFADIRTRARRAVHAAFAVPVIYYPQGTGTAKPVSPPLTARFHSRAAVAADPMGGGYAQIQEGVTRVVFSRDQLAAAGIGLRQGDQVGFPDYGILARLDIRNTITGPVNETWSVNLK